MNLWVTIVASLLSGLVGAIITMIVNNRREIEREKVAYKKFIFQNLIAYRGDVTECYPSTGNFVLSLNQVFIAFNDSKAVISAFETYRKNRTADALVTLLKEMSKDLGIKYEFANDDLFMSPLLDVKLQRIQQK